MEEQQITVTVRFMGILENYAGARYLSIDMQEKKSVDDLLNLLVKLLPPAYQNLLMQKQDGEPFLRVLLNEKLINELDFSTEIKNADKVTILPGVSGGSSNSNLS